MARDHRTGFGLHDHAGAEDRGRHRDHLVPTYEASHAHVLGVDVIAVDETWWRLVKKGASKRWWVWSVAREDAVSYRLLSSRSTDAARTVLADYMGKAIAYTSGLWPGLVRFLVDPKIPLDTNSVERALRGVAVGRKNHYGSRSERGTRVAGLFYSLIESAELCGVEPRAHLHEAVLRAVRNPGKATLARDIRSSQA